jgi:hypothetical protein
METRTVRCGFQAERNGVTHGQRSCDENPMRGKTMMQQRMAAVLCLPVFCLAVWSLSPSAHAAGDLPPAPEFVNADEAAVPDEDDAEVVLAADQVVREDCVAGGDTLHGAVYLSPRSDGTIHVERISFTIQDNTAAHNNVYARLRGDGGTTTYWAWTSRDNIRGETTYKVEVDEIVPRSHKPYMKFHLTADQNGPDPECLFYVNLY